MKLRLVVGGLVASAAIVLPTHVAPAAPKAQPGFSLILSCPGEPNLNATVPGGEADWTPAFVGHRVFLPSSFGVFTGTFTSTAGQVFPIEEPPMTQNTHKGGSHARVTCTYSIRGTEADGTFQGSGQVTGVIVGKR